MSEVFANKPLDGTPWDVAIVGSGPAGLTAAIYTTRGAASTLLFTGSAWGGQLMLTTTVDNFPGFPQGIEGPTLMQNMRSQAERFGTEVIEKNITELDTTNSPFKIKAGDKEYLAKTIIIATGAETRWLGIPGEEKLRGRGVSSCAPCDAPFFKNKNVIVVGGGDSAMEEALVLSKYCPQVTIVHRKREFRASVAMQKRVFDNPNIDVIWDSELTQMEGDQVLSSVLIKTTINSEEIKKIKEEKFEVISEDAESIVWRKPIQGVFVAIGHLPSTNIFSGKIDLDEKGYIKKIPNEKYQMATSKEGIFVAGDVHDIHYKQAITAAAFGCMAGMETLKSLDLEPPTY